MEPRDILKKYFGYDNFRTPQFEIIQSVLEGKDTMALLPTGGGKSLCFQVPALMREGICVVISPLIALMKDQVFQLRKRDIKAAAVFSGLTYHEIDMILDNCQFGYYKFLFVSPERLKTDIFLERFKQMNVSLIAVDEAHCVSQWGYDFRPPYLEIAEIRQFHPKVPVLALTASATPVVQEDIIVKLKFRKGYRVYKKSFIRDNLSFVVRNEEAKYPKLLEIIHKLNGSGIIYVRNRNKTKEVAEYLQKNKIIADFYHAGLNTRERNIKQDDWLHNKKPVMVCTNAFGMGIDKPDVRFVIHLDVPENLEAYYQEAGRAGRDGKLSYAVLFYTQSDLDNLTERLQQRFPPAELIKKVYNSLCNYLGIAVESGNMMTYPFDMTHFCRSYKLESTLVYNCLKILEQENYLQVSEGVLMPSRAIFRVDKLGLYRFEVANAVYAPLVKSMLRTYGGIFDHYAKISEKELAKQVLLDEKEVMKQLSFLHKNKIITYIPSSDQPTITLLTERLHETNLYLNTQYIRQRKKINEEQLKAILSYTEQQADCRQVIICSYFGEKEVVPCGKCDICLEKKRKLEQDANFRKAKKEILEKMDNKWNKVEELLPRNAHFAKALYKEVIRFLLDEKVIVMNDKNELKRV